MKTTIPLFSAGLFFLNGAAALEVLEPGYRVSVYATYTCPMPLEAIGMPRGMAFDPEGNLYLTQWSGYPDYGSIYRVSPARTAVEWRTGFGTPRRILWAGGSEFGDYLYLTDGNPSTVCRLGLDGAVSVFAGLNDTAHSLALDRSGLYGGNLFVATRGYDAVYAVSPSGQVSLFSSFPGPTPSGHLDLAFDPSPYDGQLLYAALDVPVGWSGVGGVFSLDPSGQATRSAADIVSAWSVAFPRGEAFGGDPFVCGRVGEDAHNALWRVSRNGQIAPFARATIGNELQVLAFAPDGAMLVPEFSFAEQRVTIQRITRHAAVDIRPGSCPNPLNPGSRGVLPVALVGTPIFDVRAVDRASIRLLNVPAIRSHYEDVTAPATSAEACSGSAESPDGIADLILHFETERIVAALLNNSASLRQETMLPSTLTGRCADQTPFEGTDCVVIRGNAPSHQNPRIAPGTALALAALATTDLHRADCLPGALTEGFPTNGPGSLDPTFDPTAGGTLPGIESDSLPAGVHALGLQGDGKIVVGGWFDRINGVPRPGLARLHSNGMLDSSFEPPWTNLLNVFALALLPDQKLLVLGRSTTGERHPYGGLVRLNPDGSRDPTFTNFWSGYWIPYVQCLAVQADGKLLVGGEFMEPRTGIARFNSDGTLDETFNPPLLPAYDGATVKVIVVQPDSRILVGGSYGIGLLRLNPDGSEDDSFQLGLEIGGSVNAIQLQPDGRILIGGFIDCTCDDEVHNVMRLRADGSVDGSFAAILDIVPLALALQPDGRILAAGKCYGDAQNSTIYRFNPDGRRDTSFQASMDIWYGWPMVTTMAILPDGQILIGGVFTNANGIPAVAVARLNGGVSSGPPTLWSGPHSLTRFAGQTATLTASVVGAPLLRYQWWFERNPIPGATDATLTLTNLQRAQAGGYLVTVSNAFGGIISPAATLTVLPRPSGPGSVDISFDPTASGRWVGVAGQGASVNAIAVEPDGTVLIGGDFIGINTQRRNGVARLRPDGSLDPSFDGLGVGGAVYALVRQADGKVIVGGRFSVADGQPHESIARFNPDGSLDHGFNARCTGAPWAWVTSLALQADGKIVVGGRFCSVNGVARTNLARLNTNGTLDWSFSSGYAWGGEATWICSVAVQADGKLLVGGPFRTPHPGVARLHPDGNLDAGFVPQIEADSPGIECVVLQSDGKIIVGGRFYKWGANLARVARFNSDGSQDTSFDAGEVFRLGGVHTAAVQADGKILLGGWCYPANHGPVRLNTDGSIDPGFHPGSAEYPDSPCIEAIVLDASNRVLVGMEQTRSSFRSLVRLNADGNQDTQFTLHLEANRSEVRSVAVQPDGKILILGLFDSVNSQPRRNLVRLHQDGTLDTGFNPDTGSLFYGDALTVQRDGKIVVGGFDEFEEPDDWLFRLNADGSRDLTFHVGAPAGGRPAVHAIVLQADEKILVGGEFERVDGFDRNGIVRLNPDGSVDASFVPPRIFVSTDYGVYAMAVQPDGKILIAGSFGLVSGDLLLSGLARLNGDGSLDLSFRPDQWLMEGDARALLVQSDGTMIVGGRMQFTDAPQGALVSLFRVNPDGSLHSIIELPPGLDSEVRALTMGPPGCIYAGGIYHDIQPNAAFVVQINGTGGIDANFHPQFEEISGEVSIASLAVQADGQLVVGGNFSAVNGLPAHDIVRLNGGNVGPSLTTQLTNQTGFAGQSAAFTITASGTPPLSYQWLFNGDPIADATNSTLVIPHLSFAHTGTYSVVVSNGAGTVTSDSATLTVLSPEASSVWARRLGNLQGESCNDLAVDAAGNTYLVGIFLSTLDLGGLTLTSAGAWDFFVAKYDPNGSLVWAQRGGGAYVGASGSVDDTATSVAVDEAGCVYVTGYYHGPADIGGRQIPATASTRSFLAKYDAAGNLVWLLSQDGLPSIDSGGTDLALDAAGNVYSAGFGHNSAEPYYTAVIERRSPAGDTQWRRTFPVDYTPWDHRIAVDDHTNVFLSGTFWSHLAIDSLTATNRSQWASFFLVKFQQGEPQWLRYADMPFGTCAFVDNISVDQLGNVLVCGHFTGTLLLGSTSLTSRGEEDVFLAKYSQAGELLWVRQAGGPAHDIAKAWTDPLGGIYLASRFQGTTHLGDQIVVGDPNHGVCLATMTPLGEPRWVELTGLPEICRFELAVHNQRAIYLAGNFCGTATFGTNRFVSVGCADMFLAKLDIPLLPTPHPADLTPSDWQMTSMEVDNYAAAWRRGALWPLPPDPISIDYVTRAGALWRGGPCYEWDATVATAPLWWVACPSDAPTAVATVLDEVAGQAQDDGVELQFIPSHPHPVMITVKPAVSVKAWAVEDQPPPGWTVDSLSDSGTFDLVNGKVKWGPFYDHSSRTLKYKAWPPSNAPREVVFTGRASFDGFGRDIVGTRHRRAGSRLTGVVSAGHGGLRLALSGEVGARYVIEASTDLITWTPLVALTNLLGQAEFTDRDWTRVNHRFYRALSVP